jgi:hypothetical protein
MVEEMQKRMPSFHKVNRTRCFLHILNLVAKSLLKMFELPERKSEDLTDCEREVLGELIELAEGTIAEEALTQKEREWDLGLDGDEVDDDDNTEEWVDKVDMAPGKVKELQEKVVPITRVLVKVSYLTTYRTTF